MMSVLWGAMFVIGGIVLGIQSGGETVGIEMLNGAQDAVMLCLSLAGGYMLWMGLLGIAKQAGLIKALSKCLQRPIRFLFPNVSQDAAGAITLNLAANMLGMGNAATPFGLEAMQELNKTNPDKNTATHAMCMFLTINASAVQLLPTTIITLRAAAGSINPSSIVVPSLISSGVATAVAILLSKWQANKQL